MVHINIFKVEEEMKRKKIVFKIISKQQIVQTKNLALLKVSELNMLNDRINYPFLVIY